MTEYSPLSLALDRLEKALLSVEAGLEQRLTHSSDERIVLLQEELARLNDDRANLGVSLDHITAHAKTLETTNQDVSARLDEAIETIRNVLEAHGG